MTNTPTPAYEMHGISYCPTCTAEVLVQTEPYSLVKRIEIDWGDKPEADLNYIAWVFDIDRNDFDLCREKGFPVPMEHVEAGTMCAECMQLFQ